MKRLLLLLSIILPGACTTKYQDKPVDPTSNWWEKASPDQLLDSVQQQSFRYFWDFAEPNSGLARERFHPNQDPTTYDSNIVTSGGTGFGIMSILVAIERKFISREAGIARLSKIVAFLEKAERFHGVWPHWINGKNGKVKPFSPKDDGGDLVESAFLMQGLLCVRQYCDQSLEVEKQLAERIQKLWEAMEWNWYTNNSQNLYWHWSPNHGWEMNFALQGYNETLISYILATASPTYAISPEVYHHCWARNGDIIAKDQYYKLDRVLDHYPVGDAPVGPLFWSHYSYLGLDPRKLKDKYADYWKLNRNHALIHYQHCIENPNNYTGYGPDCWGLTASYSRNEDGSVGYSAHQPTDDKGIISPTAALSSMPYTPKETLAAIRGFYGKYGEFLLGPAGFYDAFRPSDQWVAPQYLAIDQGPIIVMIENHRSALLWDLFMSCPEIQEGLEKLGFSW